MKGTHGREATAEDHQKAFGETAFLIDIFTNTIDLIMGGSTASVGRIAGRDMARKLPGTRQHTALAPAIEDLAERMKGGFEFRLVGDGENQELHFRRCVFQDVCATRGLALGGPACKLFHSYLDGQINELLSRPVKSELLECGTSCRVSIKTQ